MNALSAALDVEFIAPEELDASDVEVAPEPKPRGRPAKVIKVKPEAKPEPKPEPIAAKPEAKKFQLKKAAPKVEEDDWEAKYNALIEEVVELRKLKAKVDAEREAKRTRSKNRDAAKKAGTYVPKRGGGKKAAPEDTIRKIVREEVNKMVSGSREEPLAIEDGGRCCVEGCENVATDTGACEDCEAEAAEE